MCMQIFDQIYYENFERAKKEQEEREREEALRAQQAAWAAMGHQGGPPGLEGMCTCENTALLCVLQPCYLIYRSHNCQENRYVVSYCSLIF